MRLPIENPTGAPMPVSFYARYSTDEQNPRSNADQFGSCRRLLQRWNVTNVTIDELCDEGISGEITNRPGISRLREGILQGRWKLLIVEESSRLFRHPSECIRFIEIAVDHGMRVICLNDFIDTNSETWLEDLTEAQKHHYKSNRLTRARVARSMESRWDEGWAVTWLKPGYRRKPVILNPDPTEQKGPYVDEVDPEHAAIMEKVLVRIGAKEPLDSVVDWLNTTELPSCGGWEEANGIGNWTKDRLIARVRDRIYVGQDGHEAHPEYGRNVPNPKRWPGAPSRDAAPSHHDGRHLA